MKSVIALILLTQIGLSFAENTIIAIVNGDLITLQSIEEEVSLTAPYAEKMSVLNKQIDTLIKLKKASEFDLSLSKEDLDRAIINVAKYNDIDVTEFKNYPGFKSLENKIIVNLTLLKLQQFVTKDIDLDISKKELINNCTSNSNYKKQIKIAQIIISKVENNNESKINNELRTKEFLKKLSNHISNGASFDALAKLHSQHPSYVDGGLSEWLFIENPILKMLDKLKGNEVSIIYPIDNSWGIAIKIDERFLDLNLKKCEDDLKNMKIQDFYLLWVEGLRDSSKIEIFSQKLL